ncbi:MAG: CZB domain-containing protein [Thermoanaerobaculia bacterium]|jgi:hypothetical protein
MIDFDAAIEAHVEWKMRLRILLDSGEAASAYPDELEAADRCSFGRWLRSDGRRLESDPVYGALDRFHAEFHRSAATVIHLAAVGERLQAESTLAGEYARNSVNLLSALMELRRRVGAQGDL